MPRSLALFALLAATAACGDGSTNPPAEGIDTTLVLLPPSLTLAIGQTRAVAAYLLVGDSDTVVVGPVWTSRDTLVASVNAGGVVTGRAAGVTRVIANAVGRADSIAVTVQGEPLNPVGLRRLASTLSQPVFLTSAPADFERLYVVEKTGAIRILRNDTLLATPFLDLSDLVSSGGEQGLLSMAFHPSFATNGYVFVSYTDTLGDSKVVRYQATDPETVDAGSALEILSVDQPYSNHNGGLVAFGPDGMLYVGLGDGGSGGDPDGNGQNKGTLLGAILRLDVDGGTPYAIPADNPFVGEAGSRGEIWAYGLRNPWRFSFDRGTGDLYIGDVGQGQREEIDVQPAASTGGENYGWNIMEGTSCYNAATCQTQGLTLPVAEYTHAEGCSITGGYVYRGTVVSALQDLYLYADYCAGWVRSLTYVGGQVVDSQEWPDLAPGGSVTSFGEDGSGELYIMTLDGKLFRVVSN